MQSISLLKMATRNGLEPSTSSVTGWRANRLHHRARTACIIAHVLQFVKRKNAFFYIFLAPESVEQTGIIL